MSANKPADEVDLSRMRHELRTPINQIMRTLRLAVQCVVLGAIVCGAYAEKVDMTPEKLRQTASHIILGTVLQIYERSETNGGWDTTHYLAEVEANAVEKGDKISKGDLVYIRYWRRGWVGAENDLRRIDTSGHRGLPKRNEFLRIYLVRNGYDGFSVTGDGGFNVIGANGFERLKKRTP
jgi:hypothetical protein